MRRNTLCGVILLAVFFPHFCRALVCYDNVVTEEPVLIGCNFRGAACGVTNKTTTISVDGFNTTDHKVLYHCAGRSTSCAAGPLNHCNAQSESEHVSCLTSCCESDKCNLPADPEFKVKTIPEKTALGCYQLVGDEEKRVKCMFEGAVCLYLDIGPPDYLTWTSYEKTQKRSGSQLCTTKKFCDTMKTACDARNGYQNDWDVTTDRCTTTCCTTDYCNPLPSYTHYQDHDQHPNAKAVKPTHTRGIGHKHKNPKTEAPSEKDSFDDSVFDNLPADDNYYDNSDDSGYTYSYTSDKGIWTGLGIVLTIICFVVCMAIRFNRSRKATVKYVTMRNT